MKAIEVICQSAEKDFVSDFLNQPFEDMIKFVVDVRKDVMAIGGSMHADAEAVLLENGSNQSDVWGGNFFPKNPAASQIELHSLINIRPGDGNRALIVQDNLLAEKIKKIVTHLLMLPW